MIKNNKTKPQWGHLASTSVFSWDECECGLREGGGLTPTREGVDHTTAQEPTLPKQAVDRNPSLPPSPLPRPYPHLDSLPTQSLYAAVTRSLYAAVTTPVHTWEAASRLPACLPARLLAESTLGIYPVENKPNLPCSLSPNDPLAVPPALFSSYTPSPSHCFSNLGEGEDDPGSVENTTVMLKILNHELNKMMAFQGAHTAENWSLYTETRS